MWGRRRGQGDDEGIRRRWKRDEAQDGGSKKKINATFLIRRHVLRSPPHLAYECYIDDDMCLGCVYQPSGRRGVTLGRA